MSPIVDINIHSLNDFRNQPLPDMNWLIENIVREESLTYIYGPPGSGKTIFMFYAVTCAVKGINVFNYEVEKPVGILWIDEESRERGCIYLAHVIPNGKTFKGVNFDNVNFNIATDNNINILADVGKIEELIKQYKPDIIVIDSIAKVFPYDERDKTHVRLIYSYLSPLITKYKVSFILIHHSRKTQFGQKKSLNEISGSHEFSAQCDDLIFIEKIKTENDKTRCMLTSQKKRYGVGFESIDFDIFGNGTYLDVEYSGPSSENVKKSGKKIMFEIKGEVIKYIGNNPSNEYTTTELIEAMEKLGYGDTYIRKAIYKDKKYSLMADGMLENIKKGYWKIVNYKVENKEDDNIYTL